MARRFTSDMTHASTLGISMMTAFCAVAPRYGLRLVGIEDDANEHSDFWQQVAQELIDSNSTPTAHQGADQTPPVASPETKTP